MADVSLEKRSYLHTDTRNRTHNPGRIDLTLNILRNGGLSQNQRDKLEEILPEEEALKRIRSIIYNATAEVTQILTETGGDVGRSTAFVDAQLDANAIATAAYLLGRKSSVVFELR